MIGILSREMNNPRQATQNERGNDFQNVEKKDFDVFQADSDADDSNDDSLKYTTILTVAVVVKISFEGVLRCH